MLISTEKLIAEDFFQPGIGYNDPMNLLILGLFLIALSKIAGNKFRRKNSFLRQLDSKELSRTENHAREHVTDMGNSSWQNKGEGTVCLIKDSNLLCGDSI